MINPRNLIIDLLPSFRRTPKIVALLTIFAEELRKLQNDFFGVYAINFGFFPIWNITQTYTINSRAFYGKSYFICVENSSTGAVPGQSTDWKMISPNFLGVDLRLAGNGTKIVLEFLLNTWFVTQFRQPATNQLSDIYLTTNKALMPPVFRVGYSENESTKVRKDVSDGLVMNEYDFTNIYNLTINVPTWLQVTENDVRRFADLYINAGIKYKINYY